MILKYLNNKKLKRAVRGSFFIEYFQVKATVGLLQAMTLASYFFCHKYVSEKLIKEANFSKLSRAVQKNLTPYAVATSLLYLIPTLLLL